MARTRASAPTSSLQGDSIVIFVTVETTHFDSLIQEVDQLISSGTVRDHVICQIGSGNYIPNHADYFRFQPSIDDWIGQSDLVICHGGVTVLSLLQKKKRFVAIANTVLAGDHQTAFLSRLAQDTPFPWGRNVKDLGPMIELALGQPAPSYELPHLAEALINII